MFEGVSTALITPFVDMSGFMPEIHEKKFRELVRRQFKRGADGVVTSGTTGESPTLTHEEHQILLEIALDEKPKDKFVIAGTGSNSTYEAFCMTTLAKNMGADAALVVVPYYNKPSQAEIFQYYKDLDIIGIPIIAYDVPSRCGVGMNARTTLDVLNLDNVVALKDATGRVNFKTVEDKVDTAEIADMFPTGKVWLSGNDEDTLLLKSFGGKGVISVVANIHPEIMRKVLAPVIMYAEEAQAKYLNLMKAMFIESNPKPIKEAIYMVGLIDNARFRKPLIGMNSENKAKLEAVLSQYDLSKI